MLSRSSRTPRRERRRRVVAAAFLPFRRARLAPRLTRAPFSPSHKHTENRRHGGDDDANRYEDACSDSVTSRAPFCYVWPPSCPEGVELQKSSFYPGYFTGFCQVKERPAASNTRTRLGCRCLQEYRYYGDVVKGGKCTTGRKQLAGEKFCYVDPSTCAPGKAKPSALYEGWFFDLCD